jgi:uncharacterized glyoxalase superfamily protein PhnB
MLYSLFEIILYVSDQEKSKVFYAEILKQEPSLHVPGMTEFTISSQLKLGLMPENGIANILSETMPHPKLANGIPKCELYLVSHQAEELFLLALSLGAKKVSDIKDRDWGDKVGYVADFDGNIIAFAKKIKIL